MYLTNEEMRPKLEGVGSQLIPVIAYGDALGLPVEKKTAGQIENRYGRVKSLMAITDNPFIGQYEAGTWSDDTQLSLAMAEALIEAEGFDMETIANAHIKALEMSHMGWGKSTQESVERLKKGERWWTSGNLKGEGNGVLMKLAPLVYWQIARDVDHWERQRQIEDLTRMTHNNDLSVVTALVHADILDVLARDVDIREGVDDIDFHFVVIRAAEQARQFERKYSGAGAKTSYILGEMALDGFGLTKERIQMYCPGGGFHSPETLGMVYGHFALQATYPEVMIETVNAGGDTDSTGSIVSAMALFAYGSVELSADEHLLKDKIRLEEVSRKLAATALQS